LRGRRETSKPKRVVLSDITFVINEENYG